MSTSKSRKKNTAATAEAKPAKKARKGRAGLGMNNTGTDEPPTSEVAAAVESSTEETPPVGTPVSEVGQTGATEPPAPAAEPDTANEPPAAPILEATVPGPKLSAIGAAAKVLGEEGRPMSCQEMIDAMAAKGYWHPPAGRPRPPPFTLRSCASRRSGECKPGL